MKVLYVEDDLSSLVESIIDMFTPLLPKKLIKELKEANEDEDNYGVSNKTIKNIIEKSGVIDVCYTFKSAIETIEQYADDYDLFIIDRNLYEKDKYEETEIIDFCEKKKVDFDAKNYQCSEGDFLLSMVKAKKLKWREQFYFLTANTSNQLECEGVLKNEYDVKVFRVNNILDKSNEEHIGRLKDILNDFKRGNFRVKIKDVFAVFDQGLLSKDLEKEFVKTVSGMDNHNLTTIKDNFARIRRIQEGIYIALSKSSPDIIPIKLLKNDNGFLRMRPILKHLSGNWNYERGSHTTRQWQNGIIASYADSVYSIASDNGSHTPYESPDYLPTKYTVQSSVYALCDLLLWFKDTCK